MEIDVNLPSKLPTTVINNNTTTKRSNNMITVSPNSVDIPNTPIGKSGCCSMNILIRNYPRTPQEFYFESRGKSCKKLLKFNGSSNKILLYPEEGWARSAVTSHWIITPCKWQPNRYKIEEFIASQRHKTKAKMVRIDKSSFLIVGMFKEKKYDADFKLYLSSNISVEDYNMGYCLTGFVERLCPQTKTFQMTHFAVIKRQWPSTSSYVT